jgi:two-component system, OmpR family, KDP operon response regulator KdpE
MTRAAYRVLIVEDDPAVRAVLRTLLKGQGYSMSEAATAARAVIGARSYRPDLLLVDLGLPDADGLSVIRRVRAWSTVPILVLSSAAGEEQKIEALDVGADDYITKPFSGPELLARVRAGLRRSSHSGHQPPILRLGRLRVDLARRHVRGPRGEVHLTLLEHRLLESLARQRSRVVGRGQLLREAWGPNREADTNSLRECVSRLRAKIEPNPRRPRYILTVNGWGYRLCTKQIPGSFGPEQARSRTGAPEVTLPPPKRLPHR